MRISVVIPTLNEAAAVADAVGSVCRQGAHQVIVADGGSTDDTRARAGDADLFIQAPRGRAFQMNAGAALATGDALLFLHGDCIVEDGALEEVAGRLRGPVIAGCFRMRVRAKGVLYRMIDASATARVRLTGLVYGDQGLFLRRDDFWRLGGFPRYPLMEDLFFSRTLRRHGRIVVADRRIFVSPRRWQKAGLVRQTLRNWTLTALAAAGVAPDTLARFYPVVR